MLCNTADGRSKAWPGKEEPSRGRVAFSADAFVFRVSLAHAAVTIKNLILLKRSSTFK